ncbi:hypothetical protein KIPB_008819 [Kipferlia bialata]|uniref:Uncharacterized protein n=1 Tax=Kipferlia bialata TaxID=797122 RepID=A0A9K3D2Y7_9EUKA|nr:hypothetical protein KIPB_008819 [Kipferlia bialata]|eukprot:g8819.t1
MHCGLLCLALCVCLCVIGVSARATHGFEISYYQGHVTQDTFDCLNDEGMKFGLFQAQRFNGKYNPYLKDDIARSKASGIKTNDVYIMPDTTQDPRDQIAATIETMKSEGVLDDNMIWIDVENSDYWFPSYDDNIQFMKDMVEEGRKQWSGCSWLFGQDCIGMLTSAAEWDAITNSTEDAFFADMELW